MLYGYTAEEATRASLFRNISPDTHLVTPLIDNGLRKADCLAIIQDAGIRVPEMYRLGFNNNNCRGCPKSGMGYWNRIRACFPDRFDMDGEFRARDKLLDFPARRRTDVLRRVAD